jgi:hypothetical protein
MTASNQAVFTTSLAAPHHTSCAPKNPKPSMVCERCVRSMVTCAACSGPAAASAKRAGNVVTANREARMRTS